MPHFFNEVVNWPCIFTSWLPSLNQIASKQQRCPLCKTDGSFSLMCDWERSGAGLCHSCGFGEGIDWLKRTYAIDQDAAKQILRGEIATAAELMPMRRGSTHLGGMHPNELVIRQRLGSAKPLDLGEDNAGTRFVKPFGFKHGIVFRDILLDPQITLPLLKKKPKHASALLLVMRDSTNRRVITQSIYLNDDGEEIEVPPHPLSLRFQHAALGAAVRLSDLQPTVFVTVSIKSAFAIFARFSDQAVMATLTREGLAALQLPSFVCNVHIVVKSDGSDMDAATKLEDRLRQSGRQVDLIHDFKAIAQACEHARFAEVC